MSAAVDAARAGCAGRLGGRDVPAPGARVVSSGERYRESSGWTSKQVLDVARSVATPAARTGTTILCRARTRAVGPKRPSDPGPSAAATGTNGASHRW